MNDNMKDLLLEKIDEAELILVGIGEEFEETESNLCMSGSKVAAYGVLEKLLHDKNYFIVSTCIDDYAYNTKLNPEKIVTPCGGYRLWQCEDGCDKKVYSVESTLMEKIYGCLRNGGNTDQIQAPLCPICGKKMVFNNINAENYVEEGYLGQWNIYTKWLQGTVNKKLCVLELGVGMKYPTVIRWPFEKIVYFNQKASFFRVHSKLFQLSEKISDRGYKIEQKPVDFLINRFV